MGNIFRIIGLAILFAINAVVYYFLHSQFHFTLLVLMIIAPICAVLICLYQRWKIKVYVNRGTFEADSRNADEFISDEYARQGDEVFFTIYVKNPTLFPVLDARICIEVENSFFGTNGSKEISVPVRAIRGYKLKLPIIAQYPGVVKLTVKKIRIKDLAGFCWLKKNSDSACEYTILPKQIEGTLYEGGDLNQGMLESEESKKRGNDFSDVQEIREYIPGDKLMSIHWKLSAKRDILMVKDRVSMSDRQMVVLTELYKESKIEQNTGSNTELNEILETTYSLISMLLEDKTTVRLMYWSAARYEYEDVRIDYKEELDTAFAKMFYEKTYNVPDEAASHMAAVHPEMKAYVHVFSDGGKVRIDVKENG